MRRPSHALCHRLASRRLVSIFGLCGESGAGVIMRRRRAFLYAIIKSSGAARRRAHLKWPDEQRAQSHMRPSIIGVIDSIARVAVGDEAWRVLEDAGVNSARGECMSLRNYYVEYSSSIIYRRRYCGI